MSSAWQFIKVLCPFSYTGVIQYCFNFTENTNSTPIKMGHGGTLDKSATGVLGMTTYLADILANTKRFLKSLKFSPIAFGHKS